MPAVTVPLIDISSPTPRSRLLTLALGEKPFHFSAGQAVLLAPHGEPDARPYSIASSPERVSSTRQLELLIAIDATGPDLDWAERGAFVDIEGPLGTFTLPERIEQPRLLFVAGGTGIAPLRSMVGDILWRQPAKTISLLYSARRADDFVFIDEFRAYAQAGSLELHQTVTRDDTSWHGRRGRIGRADFEAVLHEPMQTLCFVCGPAAMVEDARVTLHAMGVPDDAIRIEGWGK